MEDWDEIENQDEYKVQVGNPRWRFKMKIKSKLEIQDGEGSSS